MNEWIDGWRIDGMDGIDGWMDGWMDEDSCMLPIDHDDCAGHVGALSVG